MNGAACPELCANSMSEPQVSNDGSEETGTEAGTGLIRFMPRMIKCYIQFQILEAERGREMISKN